MSVALIGAGLCARLLSQHGAGWDADQSSNSVACVAGPIGQANCDAVVQSRWGSIDFYVGSRRVLIPTTLVGLVYFIGIVLWFSLVARCDIWQRLQWFAVAAVATTGAAGSLFFVYIMAARLQTWCSTCLLIHLLNALVCLQLILLWRALRGFNRRHAPARRALITGLTRQTFVALATIASVSVGCWLYFDAITAAQTYWHRQHALNALVMEMSDNAELLQREFFAQPVEFVPPRNDALAAASNASATVVPRLVVFTDYDCRSCVCVEAMLQGQRSRSFRDSITVDVRHVRNDRIGPSLASLAAEAARRQGGSVGFEIMHRALFANRRARSRSAIVELARSIGLDAERLNSDMDSQEAFDAVSSDYVIAEELGISHGPVVFLDGRRVPALCLQSVTFWEHMGSLYHAQISPSEGLRLATSDGVESP